MQAISPGLHSMAGNVAVSRRLSASLAIEVHDSTRGHACRHTGAYLGSSKSLLAKIDGRAVQVAPHLVVLYDTVAIKDEPHFIEGDVIVLEDDADPLMHIEPHLAVGERAFCIATEPKLQWTDTLRASD